MPKKRKFIDKKHAVTFQVVHRSQKDPLAADEDTPQRVLLPMAGKKKKPEDVDKMKEEQRKYNIFFDDEYDYMQHIKSVDDHDVELQRVEKFRIERQKLDSGPSASNVTHSSARGNKIELPSSLFASETEEEVGLLNKAAPMGLRLDVDPDIVAAMDDDFNFDDPDNVLEDNFLELANAECSDIEEGDEEDEEDMWSDAQDSGDCNSSEMGDNVPSLDGVRFGDECAKSSRFTEYSMSSSVVKRNEQLKLLDETFEHFMEGYVDTELGGLECDEIEGHLSVDSPLLRQYAEEFAKNKRQMLENDAARRLAVLQESDEEDNLVALKVEARQADKWDCESILSTYSNIYNHPKLIPREAPKNNKIKISAKTGMPVGVLGRGLTAKALANLDAINGLHAREDDEMSTALSVLSTLSIRPKDETPKERVQRKKALKLYRKDRRLEKKANKEAFKEETKLQHKLQVHNKVSSNAVKIV
ncbi:protein LTV1 homolog [Cloeon dipterum]|uniref:protein LTV1 homolog n=1 Tax=Cloeon dipterum TaxID=197152 RepID=UPI00321F694C